MVTIAEDSAQLVIGRPDPPVACGEKNRRGERGFLQLERFFSMLRGVVAPVVNGWAVDPDIGENIDTNLWRTRTAEN